MPGHLGVHAMPGKKILFGEKKVLQVPSGLRKQPLTDGAARCRRGARRVGRLRGAKANRNERGGSRHKNVAHPVGLFLSLFEIVGH